MKTVDEMMVVEWMHRFAAAVRARRLDLGRELFHPDSTGFGTVIFRADNLDALEANQWGAVWPRTEDFDFDYVSLVIQMDTLQAVAIAAWQSFALSPEENRVREGRATVVLRLEGDRLIATHTHFSMRPNLLSP